MTAAPLWDLSKLGWGLISQPMHANEFMQTHTKTKVKVIKWNKAYEKQQFIIFQAQFINFYHQWPTRRLPPQASRGSCSHPSQVRKCWGNLWQHCRGAGQLHLQGQWPDFPGGRARRSALIMHYAGDPERRYALRYAIYSTWDLCFL